MPLPHKISRSAASPQLPREQLLAIALSCAANAIFITDCAGRIVWANQAFAGLTGYALQEVIGRTPALLKSGVQSESFYAELWHTIQAGHAWRGSVVDRRKDGSFYTADETITPLLDEQGAITHFLAIQQDMTVQQREQERERYLAYHDVLTGLPNRARFLELQQQAIACAAREQHALAVLFLDLDRFKPVNDSFGHEVGDRLLLAVAERLRSAVRWSDTVARIGGDEFAILLPDLAGKEVALALARKLTEAIARPFMIDERKIGIGASIGIAIHPADGADADELMRNADQAMYLAKREGGSRYRFHGDQPSGIT